jgi:uncharacterized protein YbaR (Trm112 family)
VQRESIEMLACPKCEKALAAVTTEDAATGEIIEGKRNDLRATRPSQSCDIFLGSSPPSTMLHRSDLKGWLRSWAWEPSFSRRRFSGFRPRNPKISTYSQSQVPPPSSPRVPSDPQQMPSRRFAI